jgi:TolB-like protein/DNA-binding winged helix-turn-helix (wHTH) protein/Tfp pilus assembly protein PilF
MATSAHPHLVLRFDAFELDVRAGELRKRGVRIRLQGQPFQVLCLLLERPGEIVTRDELRAQLWHGDTYVDFDDGLHTAVKKLRDALGDSAERPIYIETIPRRGYRFIGTLNEQGGGTVAIPELKQVVDDQPVPRLTGSRRHGLRWLAAGVSILIAVLAPSLWFYRGHVRGEAPSIRSIAVLPLENLSGDPAQDYFAAGLTDALTTELARTAGNSLRVISRTSAVKYKNKPLADIARELDVDAVVEGSVVRSGNRARITAQLVNARADKHLWAASYDRNLHDILNLQSEIAATVARQVSITLSPRAQARLAASASVDPQAYDLYQRGRYRAFSNNRQEIAATVGFLEQAVHLDPSLAAAHALLARAYSTEAFLQEPEEQGLEVKALDEVSLALKLDPDLADAYVARGVMYWTHGNQFPHERAILEHKRALQLDPNLAEAHHELGKIYLHIGLLDRAEQELRAALRLDPTNMGVRYRIAVNLLDEGKPQEAMTGLEATRAFFPDGWSYQMALALFELNRKQEAAVLIREYLRENPRDEGGLGNAMQALLYADAGQSALAERSIQASVAHGKDFGHFHHAAYAIGSAYAVMNRPKDAVRWLRAAAEDGFPCYPFFEHDTTLQNIRHDPGFLAMIEAMRTDWERRRATL